MGQIDPYPMYRGIAYSPLSALAQPITEADIIIPVNNISAFPSAPNIAVIGVDESAETIMYGGILDSSLINCTRGVEGSAKAWGQGETISRRFTNLDHQTFINNIEDLATALNATDSDLSQRITSEIANREGADALLQTGINGAISTAQSLVNVEKSRAETAEGTLQTNITNAITAAKNHTDSSLTSYLTEIETYNAIEERLKGMLKDKGSVPTRSELPTTSDDFDMYTILDEGELDENNNPKGLDVYARNTPDLVWHTINFFVDMSAYETVTGTNEKVAAAFAGSYSPTNPPPSPLKTFNVTLPVSGWTNSAPYMQVIPVAGITEFMAPKVYLSPSASVAAKVAWNDFAANGFISTSDGSITAVCGGAKPATDLSLILEAI